MVNGRELPLNPPATEDNCDPPEDKKLAEDVKVALPIVKGLLMGLIGKLLITVTPGSISFIEETTAEEAKLEKQTNNIIIINDFFMIDSIQKFIFNEFRVAY